VSLSTRARHFRITRARHFRLDSAARGRGRRIVEVRFPVADSGTGRLWTLELERVDGRPGLWPHPDEAELFSSESSFGTALDTAWRWSSEADKGAALLSVRWRVLRDEGDPRISGSSVGAAAAVGLSYLRGLAGVRRSVDRRSAVSAKVDHEGLLRSVSELPAKLEWGGRGWRRLVVCEQDAQIARDAVPGELPEIRVAHDVYEAAKEMARPLISKRGVSSVAIVVVLLMAFATWYFVTASTAAGRLSTARARDTRAFHMAALADKLGAGDPSTALRLAVSAFRLDPASVDARAALIQLTQTDPRIRSYLGVDGSPAITALAGTSSGNAAVSADASGTVRSWRPACGKCLPSILSRGTRVRALAVAPSGALVAIARGDGVSLTTLTGQPAKGWSGQVLHVGGLVDTMAINADASQIAVGTSNGGLYVWTRGRPAPEHSVVRGVGAISAATFLPDGRLVTGTAELESVRQDLSVWNTVTSGLIKTTLVPPRPPRTILSNVGIRSLAVAGPDLVIGETNIEVRPLISLNTVRTIPNTDPVVALVPLDPTHVLVGTTTSLAYGAAPAAGGAASTSPSSFMDMSVITGRQQSVAFSNSLSCLTTAITVGPRHSLLTGTTSGLLVTWSPAGLPGSQVLRMTPDSLDRSGVIASREDGSVDAFDAASGRIRTLIAANRHGAATALTAMASDIFVGYNDGTVLRLSRGHGAAPVRLLHVHEKVFSLALDPAGRLLAVGGSRGVVQLFDAASGKLLRTLPHPHLAGVYAIAFNSAGKLVASSDVKDTVLVQRVDGTATDSTALLSVGLLAWLGDDTLIAGDGLGNLYQLRLPLPPDPSPIAHPNKGNILGGVLDPAHRTLVTASADQTAVLFDIPADQTLGSFSTLDADRSGSFAAAAWAASFTPDGRYAVFGTAGGYLQTITTDTTILIARACAMAQLEPSPASTISRPDLQAARSACR
jgi:WD40 repeat protein